MSDKIIMILIGLGGGLLEGAGVASFLTLLDIVPRLTQLTNSYKYVSFYQNILIISSVSVTLGLFFNIKLYLSKFLLIPIGLFFGMYIGLLAGALAEILNVIPVLERRLKLKKNIYYPMIAISLGKVIGSLIQWLKLN